MIPVLVGLLAAAAAVIVLLSLALRTALRWHRDERDAHAGTLAQLLSMKRDGFAIAKPATVRESPDPEGEGLQRAVRSELAKRANTAQRTFLDNAIADIRRARPDVSNAAAEKEARQLLQATLDDESPT